MFLKVLLVSDDTEFVSSSSSVTLPPEIKNITLADQSQIEIHFQDGVQLPDNLLTPNISMPIFSILVEANIKITNNIYGAMHVRIHFMGNNLYDLACKVSVNVNFATALYVRVCTLHVDLAKYRAY